MNYIDELELKSLLIRIKKTRKDFNTVKTCKTIADESKKNVINNRKIKKYLKWHNKIKSKILDKNEKLADNSYIDKCKIVSNKLKKFIIEKSEKTRIDKVNYELFGICIIEMVNRILTKPQFKNYSYYDDFLSDSIYKILRYIDNFDHTKISPISKQAVNSFAYITTIIHNAIIFIINKNKKYNNFINSQYIAEKIKFNSSMGNINLVNDEYRESQKDEDKKNMFAITSTNFNEILDSVNELKQNEDITIFYFDDIDLEDIGTLYDLKKTFKRLKIYKGTCDMFDEYENGENSENSENSESIENFEDGINIEDNNKV